MLSICIEILCLSIAAFLSWIMFKDKTLVTKNNNIIMSDEMVHIPEKNNRNTFISLVIILLLIVALLTIIIDLYDNNDMININTATVSELMQLEGVGEKKAQSIVEYRKHNIFDSPSEIINVKGIGEDVYQNNKDVIIVSD